MSFSTQLGPVYLRVDRLGLAATADTMTPSDERNLRLVQADVDAALPLGIAVNVETGPVSGGGSIQHDPATGDYVGVLVLRLGKRITLTCIGLVSTKDRSSATEESSLILIGTVEHLDLQAGFVTFDGFGLIYAADRRLTSTPSAPRCRPASCATSCSHADPVKHVPELVSALRTFFPVQHGVHSYGILVKLFFGAGHPLIRADLALMLERDSVADRSRLLVLGRISSALPQDKDAILRLNLDVDRRVRPRLGRDGGRRRALRVEAVRPFRSDRRRGVPADARARGSRLRSAVSTRGSGRRRFPVRAAGNDRADRRRQPEADRRGVFRAHLQHRPVRCPTPRSTRPRTASASRVMSASTC